MGLLMRSTGLNAQMMEDAVAKMVCPACKAPEGAPCHTPSGKQRNPHMERTTALTDKVGVFQYVGRPVKA